jgi:CBS domain-containing protein
MTNPEKKISSPGSTISAACLQDFPLLEPDVLCSPASEVSTAAPLLIPAGASVSEAIERMRSAKASCVIVADDLGKPLGIFTERDLLISVAHRLPEVADKPIADFMVTDLITATADAPLAYLLTIMSDGGVRNLPLVNPDGEVVGIVTVRDIVDFLASRVLGALSDFPTL